MSDIQALISDDDFVARIATATGMRTWANVSEYSDPEELRRADEAMKQGAIDLLRANLTAAFEGYEVEGEYRVANDDEGYEGGADTLEAVKAEANQPGDRIQRRTKAVPAGPWEDVSPKWELRELTQQEDRT